LAAIREQGAVLDKRKTLAELLKPLQAKSRTGEYAAVSSGAAAQTAQN